LKQLVSKINFTEDYDLEQLATTYWTSMTRQGCNGKIVNCFSPGKEYHMFDAVFWEVFDKAETGACVAMQTIPKDFKPESTGDLGPVFSLCDSLNYLACEGIGPKSQYVAEEVAPV